MSISPTTDIVLDVARAADPERVKQAATKLGVSGQAAAAAFTQTFEAAAASAKPVVPASSAQPASDPEAAKKETLRRFEAMVLTQMLESSMTGSFGDFFGKGVAGDTWKSLLIEQIADQMAKAGGIGIATQMARTGAATVIGGDDAAGPDAQSLIVSNVERSVLRTLEPEEPTG